MSSIMMKEYKTTQKTLISFCVQVPLVKHNSEEMFEKNDKPVESIFKNSRLMLHEIVTSEDEEWVDLNKLGEEGKDSNKDTFL